MLPQRAAPRRVLVVDDSPGVLYVLKRTLERMGLEVHTADSCEAALEILPLVEFAAIITDLRLGRDERCRGLEVLSASRRASPRTRVIVLTGFGNPAVMDKAFHLGADFYFEKPVSLDRLKRAVAGLVSGEIKRAAPGRVD
jgi:DNA-binding NtrC family response regulator